MNSENNKIIDLFGKEKQAQLKSGMAYLKHILKEGKYHLILTPEEIKTIKNIVSNNLQDDLAADEIVLKESVEIEFQLAFNHIIKQRFLKTQREQRRPPK